MKDISLLYAFVLTSKVRFKVLNSLKKKPLRPVEIANLTKIKQPNVSVCLRELEKNELIECLTPNKSAWRVFSITGVGLEVLSMFKKQNYYFEIDQRPIAIAESKAKYDKKHKRKK